MLRPHPIFDIVPPADVRLCLTTLYQPRVPAGGTWLGCAPQSLSTTLYGSAAVSPAGITLPYATVVPMAGGKTIAGWWYRTGALSQNAIAFYHGEPASNGWGLICRSGTIQGIRGGVAYVSPSPAIPWTTGVWKHIAVVLLAGNNMRFFIDGKPLWTTSAGGTIRPPLNQTRLSGLTGLAGLADDLIAAVPELTAAQIRYLYESTRHRFPGA